MGWTQNVNSTMAQSVGWDSDTDEIIITWSNGRVSAYSGGTEDLADQCSRAASVGDFINSEIKPSLSHRYV